jgi:hypothetical protein
MTNLTPVQDKQVNQLIKLAIDTLIKELTAQSTAEKDKTILEQSEKIEALELKMADLETRLAELVTQTNGGTDMASLETRLTELERVKQVETTLPSSAPPTIDYTKIAAEITKTGSSLYNATITAAKKNEALAEKKARNIVVIGLPNSGRTNPAEKKQEDEKAFNELLKSLSRHALVKSTYRIPPKDKQSTNVNASDPLVVEFRFSRPVEN